MFPEHSGTQVGNFLKRRMETHFLALSCSLALLGTPPLALSLVLSGAGSLGSQGTAGAARHGRVALGTDAWDTAVGERGVCMPSARSAQLAQRGISALLFFSGLGNVPGWWFSVFPKGWYCSKGRGNSRCSLRLVWLDRWW